MKHKLKYTIIYLVILMFICTAAVFFACALADDGDTIEEAEAVPAVLDEAQYQRLLPQKERLDNERAQLKSEIDTFNSDCGNVSSGDTGKLASCKAGYQELRQRISNYKNSLNAYNSAIMEAKGRTLVEILPPDINTPVPAVNPPPTPRVVTPCTNSFNTEYLKQRTELENEYWDLEERISKEKDPIKRAELINRQTYVKSMIGFLEIKMLDRFKEEQESKKNTRIKAALAIGAVNALRYDFTTSLKFLNEALKNDPKNRGIQEAINYVNYLKDMVAGKIEFNPKWLVLVDTLSYAGSGDWNASISYLKRVRDANPDDEGIRDALNFIEGMDSYKQNTVKSEQEVQERETWDVVQRLNKAIVLARTRDYEGASRILKEARELYPNDSGIQDIANLVQGLQALKEQRESGNVASPVGIGKSVVQKVSLRQKTETDKLIAKSIDAIRNNDFKSALLLLKQARELEPADPIIRDMMNFSEGAYYQQVKNR